MALGSKGRLKMDSAIEDTDKLTKLALEINEEHELFTQVWKSSLEHARNIGDRLMLVKATLKHGEYEDWIEKNCNFTSRTARTYSYVSKNWDVWALQYKDSPWKKTEVISDFTISDFMDVVETRIHWKENFQEKQKPIVERRWNDLNNRERKIMDRIEEPYQVRGYLREVKNFILTIQTAIELEKAGLFSPEARKFTLRKNKQVREELEKLDNVLELESSKV